LETVKVLQPANLSLKINFSFFDRKVLPLGGTFLFLKQSVLT